MSSTRGIGYKGKSRGRGRSGSTDAQSTRIGQRTPEIEIDDPPADVESNGRSEGVEQRRGAAAQHTPNLSTGTCRIC